MNKKAYYPCEKVIYNTLILFFIALIFFQCNFDNTEKNSCPFIENNSLNYSIWYNTIFITAKVRDFQEDSLSPNVTLRFSLYKPSNAFFDSILFDDGTNGDIIESDNFYSFLVDSPMVESAGLYKVEITMFDTCGMELGFISDTVRKRDNYPPEIYLLEAPDTLEKGDTALFRIRASDPQGLDDISSITYTVKLPDGEFRFNRLWFLSDSGKCGSDSDEYGDRHEGDGIFTMRQPFDREGKLQGKYIFSFVAKDYHGATSDTLTVIIIKPGVTLIHPNFTDTLHYGNTLTIEWESAYISKLKLEYTMNSNESSPSFERIADDVSASKGSYDWIIPSVRPSDFCKIRVYDKQQLSRYDLSDNPFSIKP